MGFSTSMKHFVHLIRVLGGGGGGGGGGGICHSYVDSSDIKMSAKEDLIRVETYVQEGGQLTIRFGPQCEKQTTRVRKLPPILTSIMTRTT